MPGVYSPLGGQLLSAHSAQITGSAFDTRMAADRGYLFFKASGESAIFNFEASHDAAQWVIQQRVTATATQTGALQLTGYFPYVRANLTQVYSAAGGSGVVWVHWTPGLR